MNSPTRLAALLALAALALPASAKTYYVDAAAGNDANTGLSRAKAFATIQKAIDKAAAGSTILVYPGEYQAIKANNKKLAIKAVEGPGETSITAYRGEVEDDESGEMKPDYAPVAAELGAWGTQAQYVTVAQAFFSNGTVVKFWDDWSNDVDYPDDWDPEAHWWTPSYVFVSARPRGWTSWDPPEGVEYEFREDSGQMVKTGRKEPVFKGGKNTVLTGFCIENGERAVWGGTVNHCSISFFALPEERDWSVETPYEEYGIVFRSTLSDCTICSIATPTRYMLTGMVVSDSTLNRCDIFGVAASESIVNNSTLMNCRLARNRQESVNGRSEYFTVVDGSVLYNCTIVDNEVGSCDDWHSDIVETDETDPDAWYEEEDGRYYKYGIVIDGSDPNYAVGWSDVYGCIIAGNRDGEGNPANVRLVVDSTTGETVAGDFMNHVGSDSWTDEETGEEVTESWSSLAWYTMMNSCVEDILVEQKGNNTKKGYKNSTGNISANPRFVDAEDWDYRLAPWSPCVDAGADYTKKTGKYDLDGGARKVGKVDMGAYELPASTPVPADYDGDGFTDPALFFASTGEWWIWGSQAGLGTSAVPFRMETFEGKGLVPLAGDFDNDGYADPGVFTAAESAPRFVFADADGYRTCATFGTKGATPVAARLKGRPGAAFGVYTANAKKPAFSFRDGPTVTFGAKGAKPVAADFTGDADDELGVYTASAAKPAFSALQSDKNYATALPFEIPANPFCPTVRKSIPLGTKGSVPCCADYDGDGKADFATYSGSAAAPAFVRLPSSTKYSETRTLPMGKKGNAAVPGVYESAYGPASPAVWTGRSWVWVDSTFADLALVGE